MLLVIDRLPFFLGVLFSWGLVTSFPFPRGTFDCPTHGLCQVLCVICNRFVFLIHLPHWNWWERHLFCWTCLLAPSSVCKGQNLVLLPACHSKTGRHRAGQCQKPCTKISNPYNYPVQPLPIPTHIPKSLEQSWSRLKDDEPIPVSSWHVGTLVRRQSLGIRTCHIGRPILCSQDREEDLAIALGFLTLKAGGWKTDRFRLKLSLCQCFMCSATWPWLFGPMTFPNC